MKRILMSFILLLGFVLALSATDYTVQTQTKAPDTAKFEIITGSLAVKQTYLLDRYTGETWILVVDSKSNYWWEAIDIEKNEDDIVPKGYSEPVYQIVLSGIAVKGTYLINTLTGATWTLYRDSDTDSYFWGVVGSPK